MGDVFFFLISNEILIGVVSGVGLVVILVVIIIIVICRNWNKVNSGNIDYFLLVNDNVVYVRVDEIYIFWFWMNVILFVIMLDWDCLCSEW